MSINRISKIVITGPESSGKTTLANLLSKQLQVPLIEEYARTYLENLGRKYIYDDLEIIALKQIAIESAYSNKSLIICDTDILTIIIWAQDKFGITEEWMVRQWLSENKTIYFLCKPDFPWKPDPLREDSERRGLIYDLYKTKLETYNKEFYEVPGNVEVRIAQIISLFNRLQH